MLSNCLVLYVPIWIYLLLLFYSNNSILPPAISSLANWAKLITPSNQFTSSILSSKPFLSLYLVSASRYAPGQSIFHSVGWMISSRCTSNPVISLRTLPCPHAKVQLLNWISRQARIWTLFSSTANSHIAFFFSILSCFSVLHILLNPPYQHHHIMFSPLAFVWMKFYKIISMTPN